MVLELAQRGSLDGVLQELAHGGATECPSHAVLLTAASQVYIGVASAAVILSCCALNCSLQGVYFCQYIITSVVVLLFQVDKCKFLYIYFVHVEFTHVEFTHVGFSHVEFTFQHTS